MKLRTVVPNVPDPRGKQGQDYFLWSILGLIAVSLWCGRRGMLAAFHLGRSLTKRQRLARGFTKGVTPGHATLTETLRAIDGGTLADLLAAACFAEGEDQRHSHRPSTSLRTRGKTMRATKERRWPCDAWAGGVRCRSANHSRRRGRARAKGMGLPDAEIAGSTRCEGHVVSGDAMFWQKSMVAKIAEKGGGSLVPVKDNQKNLRENIETAFNEPVFPPRLVCGRSRKGAWAHRTARDRRASSRSRRHRARLAEGKTHLPRHPLSAGPRRMAKGKPVKKKSPI